MTDLGVIYRCTECGYTSKSLGWLHGHAEKHRGWHGLQWPWNIGDADALMDYTEIIHVIDYDVHQSVNELQQVTRDE